MSLSSKISKCNVKSAGDFDDYSRICRNFLSFASSKQLGRGEEEQTSETSEKIIFYLHQENLKGDNLCFDKMKTQSE